MKKSIIQPIRTLVTAMAILQGFILCAQQNTIWDKNNTRPGITPNMNVPAVASSFVATNISNVSSGNYYDEIQWTAQSEQETRTFVVEYSYDGIHFQSAGETVPVAGIYRLRHQTSGTEPLLYRLRMEALDGRYTYSYNILLNGVEVSPVKIYPTVVSGNVVNVIARFPVENITVIGSNGQPVFTKVVGGRSESITVELPSLAKGMYWMNFTGQGWKTTEKFIIQ